MAQKCSQRFLIFVLFAKNKTAIIVSTYNKKKRAMDQFVFILFYLSVIVMYLHINN